MQPLLAWRQGGQVSHTLDAVTRKDKNGKVVGHHDFAAHEAANAPLTDFWIVHSAVASATWPEWLGRNAHQFTVEIGPGGRIKALIHRTSGFRRDRQTVEDAIYQRKEAAIKAAERNGGRAVADLRDIVGGPDRPLSISTDGQTIPRRRPPVIGAR